MAGSGRSALAALPRPQHSSEARDAYDAGLCQQLATDDDLWAGWTGFISAAEAAVENDEWLGLCADERDLDASFDEE